MVVELGNEIIYWWFWEGRGDSHLLVCCLSALFLQPSSYEGILLHASWLTSWTCAFLFWVFFFSIEMSYSEVWRVLARVVNLHCIPFFLDGSPLFNTFVLPFSCKKFSGASSKHSSQPVGAEGVKGSSQTRVPQIINILSSTAWDWKILMVALALSVITQLL